MVTDKRRCVRETALFKGRVRRESCCLCNGQRSAMTDFSTIRLQWRLSIHFGWSRKIYDIHSIITIGNLFLFRVAARKSTAIFPFRATTPAVTSYMLKYAFIFQSWLGIVSQTEQTFHSSQDVKIIGFLNGNLNPSVRRLVSI